MKRRTLKSKELEIDSHGNFSQLANSLRRSVIISPLMTPPSIGKPYESCVQEQKDTSYFNLEGSLPRPSCFHAVNVSINTLNLICSSNQMDQSLEEKISQLEQHLEHLSQLTQNEDSRRR
ncbi:unnamed protein product [Trifolium pratense]|uniref:Uncharacterized protein n=1 Tax=Trifolium pratense TaxID=57577 RepID=A0ACB0KBB7_TRIPR|nr:unnamed protein product [Trifolium pratense]